MELDRASDHASEVVTIDSLLDVLLERVFDALDNPSRCALQHPCSALATYTNANLITTGLHLGCAANDGALSSTHPQIFSPVRVSRKLNRFPASCAG